MSIKGMLSVFALASVLTLTVTTPVRAASGVVVLSQQCGYVLLDSDSGQVLLKILKGQRPQRGDTLVGSLKPRQFSNLTNKRDSKSLNVWVDMVDRQGTNRALNKYTKYCS